MVHLSNIKGNKAIMAKNYNDYKYFENRPDVVKIFDDLEAWHDHCRFNLLDFNPADLYKSQAYKDFSRRKNGYKGYQGRNGNAKFTGERKPYLGKNPRPQNGQRFSR
jgi:hypothetical protein